MCGPAVGGAVERAKGPAIGAVEPVGSQSQGDLLQGPGRELAPGSRCAENKLVETKRRAARTSASRRKPASAAEHAGCPFAMQSRVGGRRRRRIRLSLRCCLPSSPSAHHLSLPAARHPTSSLFLLSPCLLHYISLPYVVLATTNLSPGRVNFTIASLRCWLFLPSGAACAPH